MPRSTVPISALSNETFTPPASTWWTGSARALGVEAADLLRRPAAERRRTKEADAVQALKSKFGSGAGATRFREPGLKAARPDAVPRQPPSPILADNARNQRPARRAGRWVWFAQSPLALRLRDQIRV